MDLLIYLWEPVIIPSAQRNSGRVCWFHSICLSVHPSCMLCRLCDSLPVSLIIFMCGTNTTHLGVGVGGCGVDVLHTISKSIGQSQGHAGCLNFYSWGNGYPGRSPIYSFLLLLRSSCTLVEPACRGQSVPEQLGTGPIPQTALWAYKANLVKIYIAFT